MFTLLALLTFGAAPATCEVPSSVVTLVSTHDYTPDMRACLGEEDSDIVIYLLENS